MATHAFRPIAPLYRVGRERFNDVALTAAQDFSTGAVIVQNASESTYEEAAADPSAISGIALAAAADATPVDTFGYNAASVPIAGPDQVFIGSLASAAATNASPVTVANVSAVVGVSYGLAENTESGYWVVDQTDTTNTRVRVTGVHDDMEDADGNIWVHFVILAANQEAIS